MDGVIIMAIIMAIIITGKLLYHTEQTCNQFIEELRKGFLLMIQWLGVEANIIEDDFCNFINEGKIEAIEDFKKAIESVGAGSCPGITFDFNMNSITFKFFKWEASLEKINAYIQMAALLNQSAKASKHASFKSKDTDNDKFTFRVWLVKIGMIGDEYKVARKVLIEKLSENSAFRGGKKPEKVVAE